MFVFFPENQARVQLERQDVRNIGGKEERKETHLSVTCLRCHCPFFARDRAKVLEAMPAPVDVFIFSFY